MIGTVGEIRLFAFPNAPTGWLPCDGRELPVVGKYWALHNNNGRDHGGHEDATFRLPDLRGRAVLGATSLITGGDYEPGFRGGTEAVTLTAAQLPAHTHSVMAANVAGNFPLPQNAMFAVPTEYRGTKVPIYSPGSSANTPLDAATVRDAGSTASHPNMQPFAVVGFCICYAGAEPLDQRYVLPPG